MFSRWTVILSAALMAVASLAADTRQPASAQPTPIPTNRPVVVLDGLKIYHESKLSLQLQKDLQGWQETAKAEMQPKIDDLRKRQAELQDQASKLSPADKEKKTKEMQDLQQALYQQQRQLQQEGQERQRAASQKFQAALSPIVEQLARENGWDVVLNKSEQTAVWTNSAVDITDVVLRRMDAATPAPAAPAPK